MTKTSYLEATRKIETRKEIMKRLPSSVHTLVGLAGPNINEYIEWGKSYGIKRFILYENNPLVMLDQLSKLKYDCTYIFGDINDVFIPDNNKHILYDLDYCCTFRKVKDNIIKFKDTNYMITLSLRQKGGFYNTTFQFRKIMGLKKSDESHLSIHRYFDTSPMITLTNI